MATNLFQKKMSLIIYTLDILWAVSDTLYVYILFFAVFYILASQFFSVLYCELFGII